ncbi:MAG: PhzF family phenazine biosynthesis protein [Rubrivivax sp.]|nr:PhzF family phenazine biosynthesis protein [Rubrivivax sp.]
MPTTHLFHQLDVFSAQALMGNPLAVVHNAQGLDDAQLQRLARWTNLSETAFLMPPADPQADYRVRIFTPGGELPFAGHPTLGSCAAWLAAGGRPREAERIIQECGIGLVTLRRQGERLAFRAPPLRESGPVDEATGQRIAVALRVSPPQLLDLRWLVNGPRWIGVLMRSREEVLALQPDWAAMGELALGVAAPTGLAEPAFEVRAFVPSMGVPEDPVTGSLQAGLAQWLIGEALAPPRYVAAQGTALGRAGRVHVERDGADIWIGGDVRLCIRGELQLDSRGPQA